MTDAPTPKRPARLAQAAAPAAPQMPTIGKIVVYQPFGGETGRGVPAIITGVSETADMMVNLTVFPDGRAPEGFTMRAENVRYSAAGETGTWRWPERV